MGRFRELEEFKRNFESLPAADLTRWRVYWLQHAQHLAPSVKKEALRRIHQIDKRLHQLASESD
jgi:hypothetical protein